MTPTEYVKIFTALLVITNPLGAMPTFVSLTRGQTRRQLESTARTAAVTVSVVLMVACLAGQSLLSLLGISIASFQVGGGILILLLAVAMMHGRRSESKQTREEGREAETKEDIAVVPLAIPLMSGPGSISTMIIYSHETGGWGQILFLLLASVAVGALVWIALRLAVPVSSYLGRTGLNIVTRLMGLLLAAIAVELIAKGLVQLLPGLS